MTLAQAGADVVITDILVEDDPDLQKSAEELGSALAQYATSQGWVHTNQTAEEVRKMGRRSVAIKMDVTNREQVREVFKKVKGTSSGASTSWSTTRRPWTTRRRFRT